MKRIKFFTNKSLEYYIFQFSFIIFIFFPKINIIAIKGYWQGIRIEDIMLLVISLTFLLNSKKYFIFHQTKFRYFEKLNIFIFYIFFSNIIAFFNGFNPSFVMIVRLFEYLILVLFLKNLSYKKKDLSNYIFIFFIINLIVSTLQNYNFIGSISSRGYLDHAHALNTRSFGILGGSWELAVVISILFYLVLLIENRQKLRFFYFLATVYLLISAQSRTVTIAFFLSFFFYFLNYFFKNDFNFKIKIIIFVVIGLFSFIVFNIEFSKESFLGKLQLINFELIYRIFTDIMFMEENIMQGDINEPGNYLKLLPYPSEILDNHLSFVIRVNEWKVQYELFSKNYISQIFGSGLNSIYMESFIFRVLFSFGIVGIFLFIILIINIPIHILIFYIIISINLDIFVSFKIFFFTILYFKILNYE